MERIFQQLFYCGGVEIIDIGIVVQKEILIYVSGRYNDNDC